MPLAFDDDVGSTATDQGEKPGRRDTRQRTTPETAERWLTDLAKRLRQRRTTVVAWGELHLTAPHHVPYHTPRRAQGKHLPGTRGLVVGFSVGLPFGAVAALVVNPTVGVLAGLAAGLGGALATGLRSGRVITADGMTPSTAYRLDARNTGRQLLIALAATLTVGLAAWLGTPHLEPFPRLATASGLWVTVLVATVSVFGLRGGPVMAAAESTPATARHLDAQNTRRRLLAALAVVLTAGSMFGLQVGVLVVLEQGSLANGLLYGVLAVLVGSVTLGLSFGLVTWLIAGLLTKSTPRWPDREKIGAVFTDGDVASRAVSWRAARADLLPTAWLRHQLTRYSLSRKGQQPRDVMGFLDEAHRRGVLRQIGAHYQFRHDLLQQHLARDTNRRRGKSPG